MMDGCCQYMIETKIIFQSNKFISNHSNKQTTGKMKFKQFMEIVMGVSLHVNIHSNSFNWHIFIIYSTNTMGALMALVENERIGRLNNETFDTMENLENMLLTIINYFSQCTFNR